jgi:hypothetical protein
MLGLALGFSVGLNSLYLGVGIIGEEKCGDEGEEGERFGATSFKLKLFPHTLSMGVGIIGGKPWADHHISHTDLSSHVINSLTCEPFKPMD